MVRCPLTFEPTGAVPERVRVPISRVFAGSTHKALKDDSRLPRRTPLTCSGRSGRVMKAS